MKKVKWIYRIWIAITVIIIYGNLLVRTVLANDQETTNQDFMIEDGVLEKYVGEGGDIVIPQGVTVIDRHAFASNKAITSVTLPDSVTNIGICSFFDCSNLESITLSNSLSTIGTMAFWNCTSLNRIENLGQVTSFGMDAFELTPWLEEQRAQDPFVVINGILIDGKTCNGAVTLPNTITAIADGAFGFNSKLISIVIPKSVISIGSSAFSYCGNLHTIRMSDSVTSLGEYAFESCHRLVNVVLSKSLKKIESGTFFSCRKLTRITIPESVEVLGQNAFVWCDKLKFVTLPEHIKVEWGEAFLNSNEESITIYSNPKEPITLAADSGLNYQMLAMASPKVTLSVGDTYQVTMNSLASCSWKSSHSSIASVNRYGFVSAKKKGKVTITATLYGKEYKCIITVE